MLETGKCMLYFNEQYSGVGDEVSLNDFCKNYKLPLTDITPAAPPMPEIEEE